jgi:hypothetical protein
MYWREQMAGVREEMLKLHLAVELEKGREGDLGNILEVK